MKDETQFWLDFAQQDDQSAHVLFGNQLYKPCLFHIQQSIEKWLKSITVEREFEFLRTHSIQGLINILVKNGIPVEIDADDIDLIDSIYMPVRYPLGNSLPDFEPDQEMCEQCFRIASSIKNWTYRILAVSKAKHEEVTPPEKDSPENNEPA
jgi:HEPN domain-containing protein